MWINTDMNSRSHGQRYSKCKMLCLQVGHFCEKHSTVDWGQWCKLPAWDPIGTATTWYFSLYSKSFPSKFLIFSPLPASVCHVHTHSSLLSVVSRCFITTLLTCLRVKAANKAYTWIYDAFYISIYLNIWWPLPQDGLLLS